MTLLELRCLLEVHIGHFIHFPPPCMLLSLYQLMTHAHITSSYAAAMFAPIISLNYFCITKRRALLGFLPHSKSGSISGADLLCISSAVL